MIDPTSYVAPGAVLVGDVSLGRNASVWYNAVLRGDMDSITIGDETNVQDLAVVHVDEGYPCHVGARVGVGHRAILHGCTIADECLIGMGSILLNGVSIGTGSLVGAGAVLPEGMEVPPHSLVLGVPARIVRPVEGALAVRLRENWKQYVELALRHRAGDWIHHGDVG